MLPLSPLKKEEMEYNTARPKLIIPEYGRHVQSMVDFAISIEDREERNKVARSIIDVIGNLNPHLRDVTDFQHKLWDHLFIMSDFKLDVDSPYPIPSRESLYVKPEPLPYPQSNIKYRYYGKTIINMIDYCVEMEDGELKEGLVRAIANQMKKSYLTWNKDTVADTVILKHLEELSNGKLKPSDDFVFSTVVPQAPRQIIRKKPKKNFKRRN
jgi:hypothetical protein